MKTIFKKIMLIAAALLFAGLSSSCAHNWNDRYHRPPGKAYAHYKAKEHHPGWNVKHSKSERRHPRGYQYIEIRDHHYDNNDNRRRNRR